MENVKDKPSIVEGNYFYFFIALLLLFVGSIAQRWDIYKGLLITEYLIILLPTILFIKIRGYSIKKVIRLNRISLKEIVIIPLITICAYPIGIFLNYMGIIILTLIGKVRPSPVPIPENGLEFILGFFVIAITAGICEEVMFRGLIFKSYEGIGAKKAIVISGLLFGLFHFNLQNLLGPAFLGILFGYLLYRSDSIFTTILAHTTNNGIALILSFGATKLLGDINADIASSGLEEIEDIGKSAEILGLMIWAVILASVSIISGFIIYKLISLLPKRNDINKNSYNAKNLKVTKKSRVILGSIPLILVGLLFLYQGFLFITL